MAWARLDDRFPTHQKVRPIGDAAFRLHVSAICWCAENLTDGFVGAGSLRFVADVRQPKRATTELVAVGLWDETDGGWQIHDYLDYQPSATEVKDRKRKAAEKKTDGGNGYRAEEAAKARHRDGDRCRYCGRLCNWSDRRGPAGGTYDHVVPGAGSLAENLVVACRGCNSRKGQRTPEQAGMDLLPVTDTFQVEPVTDSITNLDRSGAPAYVRESRPVPSRPAVGGSLRDGPQLADADENPDHHELEAREQLALTVCRLQSSWQLGKVRHVISEARLQAGIQRVVAALLIVAVAHDSQSPRRVLSPGYWWDEGDSRHLEALADPRLTEAIEAEAS